MIIYSPARTATQQGSGKLGKWKINFVSTLKYETFFIQPSSFLVLLCNLKDTLLVIVFGSSMDMLCPLRLSYESYG